MHLGWRPGWHSARLASAAIGLVLFFVCALYAHVRAGDYGVQFGLAIGFLCLNVAALALALN